MKNKGISLIVLIITIVVIIILATAIIVNIADTNIIGNANEAVVKQDFKTFQEELDLYIADEYTNTYGELDIATIDANTLEEVKVFIPSIEKSKYKEDIAIENGKIVIKSTMQGNEKIWAIEAITNTQITTDTPVVKLGQIVTVANSTITGGEFAYNNPVIPVGFKTSTNGGSWTIENGIVKGWNDGLVIEDASGNEFVWVPCTMDGKDGTITYTKNFTYPSYYEATSENTSDDTDSIPVSNENTQITKYGGFYIGRYEAGVPANQTAINGTSKDTSDVEGTPVVQRDATVWTNISYNKAMPNAKKLYENSTSVRSGLVTGTQWDTVCAWIQSEKDSENNPIHDVTNSVSWGNYSNTDASAKYDTDGTTQISGSKQTSGKSEIWKAKNIYDLAGNTWEWTGETDFTTYIRRGGLYDRSGSEYPASYRASRYDSSFTGGFISFRLALYVM